MIKISLDELYKRRDILKFIKLNSKVSMELLKQRMKIYSHDLTYLHKCGLLMKNIKYYKITLKGKKVLVRLENIIKNYNEIIDIIY